MAPSQLNQDREDHLLLGRMNMHQYAAWAHVHREMYSVPTAIITQGLSHTYTRMVLNMQMDPGEDSHAAGTLTGQVHAAWVVHKVQCQQHILRLSLFLPACLPLLSSLLHSSHLRSAIGCSTSLLSSTNSHSLALSHFHFAPRGHLLSKDNMPLSTLRSFTVSSAVK